MCNLPEGADIQCRLFDEVIKALPDSSSPVTVEIVNGMLFLDAVLQEVLRLYPPIGMVFRPAQKSFNISGIQVPKGTRMVLSIYLLHRNPKVWGKRAEEFIPIEIIADLNGSVDKIVREQKERCKASDKKLYRRLSQSSLFDESVNKSHVRKTARRTPRSILELLMSKYSDLSNIDLREEFKSFLAAGSETVGTAVSFAIFPCAIYLRVPIYSVVCLTKL